MPTPLTDTIQQLETLDIVDLLIEEDAVGFKQKVREYLDSLTVEAIQQLKEELQFLDEKSRFRIVRARVRMGKVQRRKKVSNIKGFTFRNGKFTRMSLGERRRRKMSQRRAKIKRKRKLTRALFKRKRSLLKRRALGLK